MERTIVTQNVVNTTLIYTCKPGYFINTTEVGITPFFIIFILLARVIAVGPLVLVLEDLLQAPERYLMRQIYFVLLRSYLFTKF